MLDQSNNFYCSQKFTWLSVDLEKKLLQSCCAAVPEKIDVTWLKQNPGQIFNTPLLLTERQQMLKNEPVSSCYQACWKSEAENLPSRRLLMGSAERTHTEIIVNGPETLNINLGRTCNLTCSYCCKHFSSAWLRDVDEHGPYLDNPRFILTPQEKLLSRLSQAEIQDSDGYQLITSEINKFKNIKEITISGGEPFLYNKLPELINGMTDVDKVYLTTGLGVNNKRFQKIVKKITNKANLLVTASAENCDKFYEFNRYGNSWATFTDNLNCLTDNGFQTGFTLVISNLTVFGLVEFLTRFKDSHKFYIYCNDPGFLKVNVLDPDTKKMIVDLIGNSDISIKQELISAIDQPCTEQQRQDLSVYLKEFTLRRNLELDIFPKTMLQWLNLI
jgi:wyosine [tRNA(Phe)-imidazoG37] synthetase (radical SAM superfamily)